MDDPQGLLRPGAPRRDGASGRRSTRAAEKHAGRADMATDTKAKPYGDVTYADPKNGKYPIDTEAHARAALVVHQRCRRTPPQYPMNGVTLSEVKDRIMAACKKFGIDVADGDSDTSAAPTRPARPAWNCSAPTRSRTSTSSPAPKATAPAASSRRTPPCSTSPPRSRTTRATTRRTRPGRVQQADRRRAAVPGRVRPGQGHLQPRHDHPRHPVRRGSRCRSASRWTSAPRPAAC